MTITFVRAKAEHAHYLFQWRNDSNTRLHSHQSDIIDWETHIKWFLSSLNLPTREIHIVELEGSAIGAIRRDQVGDSEWLLSWMLNPAYRGRGIGKRMLKQFVTEIPSIYRAEIKKENLKSIAMARFAEFQMIGESEGIETWYYSSISKVRGSPR
jgi:hypothetical protein